jgi:hypothetical protein
MIGKTLAAIAASLCLGATSAHAAPAATVEVCITDYRVQTSNARHSVSGFGRLRDGRMFSYSVAATDMAAIVGTASSITPIVAGPGTGYVAGAEPELIRTLERGAVDGAWLRMSLEASPGATQKVLFVGRAFPQTGRCSG